ncbi:hypothetical protein EDD17DRAFT_1515648 [Pisolithus thermaeus]|nr:hypothetical protein EDD17DRAFT_1515648 [Pisolithus thermaeus]
MVFFSFLARLFMVVVACPAVLGRPNPLLVTEPQEDSNVTLASRAPPAILHWAIYNDKWVSSENGPPAVSDIKVDGHWQLEKVVNYRILSKIKGYNVFVAATENSLAASVKQYGLDGALMNYEAPTLK